MIGQKSEQLTWGLAKYGRTEVQSSVNHFSNSVRAGQATLNILLLT